MIYAEVIGDPVAGSKSPIIHKYWLDRLNLAGDYRRAHVRQGMVEDYLAERRRDPNWRGCNVTIPHKETVVRLADRLESGALAIGAVNCLVPRAEGLLGTNTDIEGIAAVLDDIALEGESAVIIGAGGAARAAAAYLSSRNIGGIRVLVRDPAKADALRLVAPKSAVEIVHIDAARPLFEGATLIVNASPMGMSGSPAMPDALLSAIPRVAEGITLFDMVYDPIDTDFLLVGRPVGARLVGGLGMLVGQAARAFELFFGAPAPKFDQGLRDLLATPSGG